MEEMRMEIILQKEKCSFPIYMSIANQIEGMVNDGIIKPNDKLPTERQLCADSGISRGTIKAAFAELQKRGIITTIQGSGSFICENSYSKLHGKTSDQILEDFFNDMRSLGLSLQEIETKFTKRLVQLYDKVTKVKIAWIDTCPEFINAALTDTSQMRCITIQTFLSDEVYTNPAVLNGYDMIVVGWDNEDFVRQMNIDIKKLLKITLNLKMSCVINLAKIDLSTNTCLWCYSEKFEQIMKNVLIDFDNISVKESIVGLCTPANLANVLNRNDILLLPTEMLELKSSDYSEIFSNFKKNGGKIVPFEYQIDRGSFVHLQDMVKDIFYHFNEDPQTVC